MSVKHSQRAQHQNTWQPHRFGPTVNNRNDSPHRSFHFTFDLKWPTWVTSCQSVCVCVCACLQFPHTCVPQHMFLELHVFSRQFRVLRPGFVRGADKEAHGGKDSRTQTASLLRIHLAKFLYWISFCTAAVIGRQCGSQPMQMVSSGGKWKSTAAEPLLPPPVNGEGFKFQRKFQRRRWREDSKANCDRW